MTGALLGTPRYISPEQAAAAHNKLDHRTDLYSLGATLYELATNKPVFTGDSPHEVISQIITRDPTPPRQHLASLPRDLDTILLKCLAKESSGRYATAGQLADDLRAFLDNRPISARRTSLVEQAARWVKKQQRSLVLTSAAVAITLLLVVGSVAGSYFWRRSRLSFVKLETDHPPVVSEVLDALAKR
jgi:serine/threonine protein kinase